MLAKLFMKDRVASTVQRKLGEVSKRFARLFFESELHEKIRGTDNELKTMRFAVQALYHVVSRNEEGLLKQLDAFEYGAPDVKEDARDALQNWVKELRNEFLGRTTPELNALVRILNEVLTIFFTQELPPVVGELAWEVVKEAKLADEAMRGGYKVPAESFGRFRQAFERRFPATPRPVRGRRHAQTRSREAVIVRARRNERRKIPRRDAPLRRRPAHLQRRVRIDLRSDVRLPLQRGLPRFAR